MAHSQIIAGNNLQGLKMKSVNSHTHYMEKGLLGNGL